MIVNIAGPVRVETTPRTDVMSLSQRVGERPRICQRAHSVSTLGLGRVIYSTRTVHVGQRQSALETASPETHWRLHGPPWRDSGQNAHVFHYLLSTAEEARRVGSSQCFGSSACCVQTADARGLKFEAAHFDGRTPRPALLNGQRPFPTAPQSHIFRIFSICISNIRARFCSVQAACPRVRLNKF